MQNLSPRCEGFLDETGSETGFQGKRFQGQVRYIDHQAGSWLYLANGAPPEHFPLWTISQEALQNVLLGGKEVKPLFPIARKIQRPIIGDQSHDVQILAENGQGSRPFQMAESALRCLQEGPSLLVKMADESQNDLGIHFIVPLKFRKILPKPFVVDDNAVVNTNEAVPNDRLIVVVNRLGTISDQPRVAHEDQGRLGFPVPPPIGRDIFSKLIEQGAIGPAMNHFGGLHRLFADQNGILP